MPDKLDMRTKNITQENIEKIGTLFPHCVTEATDEQGKIRHLIDFESLKQELSESILSDINERYQFTWPDKNKSRSQANKPVSDTLRPSREDSVNFDYTKNLYIEGDNLDVLKLLRETYLGKIKMIYIDPPYNTGNDFIYRDNYRIDNAEYEYINKTCDEEGNRLFRNMDSGGRFHTDWLNMMYPRLRLAKDLLSKDGMIFISIDDNELHNLRKICDEIFGEENFIASLIWDLGTGTTAGHFTRGHEYILCYSRNKPHVSNFTNYNIDETVTHGALKKISSKNPAVDITFPKGFEFEGKNAVFQGELGESEKEYILSEKMEFIDGKLVEPTTIRAGFAMRNQIEDFIQGKDVFDTKGQRVKRFYFNSKGILFYEKEKTVINPRTVLSNIANTKMGSSELRRLFGENYFDYPKPSALIKWLIQLTCHKNDIILDFFSGSATTAHATMQLNFEDGGLRRVILIQILESTGEGSFSYRAGFENICEIGKERIRRAGKQILEENKQRKLTDDGYSDELDVGFRVLKLDSSNMKDVYYTPDNTFKHGLDELLDNVKEDRTPEDLLFQVMLELGVELSATINEEIIESKKVFSVDEDYLVACFDIDVSENVVTEIAKKKPHYAVMRDYSMSNDNIAVNFEQIFKTYSPETIRRVI